MNYLLISTYLIFFIYLFLNNGSEQKRNSKGTKLTLLVVSWLILTLLCGLRNHAVGPDTYQYFLFIEDYKNVDYSHLINQVALSLQFKNTLKDPGFYLFYKFILDVLGNNYQLFLFLYGGAFYFFSFKFLYENLKRTGEIFVGIALLVLFFNYFPYSSIRQGFAVMIALVSFKYIKNKQFYKFLLLILLGYLFHKTILIFLVVYPLYNFGVSRKLVYPFLILYPVVYIYSAQIDVFLNLIYGYEVGQEYEKVGTPILTAYSFMIVMFYLFFKNKIKSNPELVKLFQCFSFGIVILPVTWVNPNVVRLYAYFLFFTIIIVPLMLSEINKTNPKARIHAYGFLNLGLLLLLYYVHKDFKYEFYWNYMQLGDNY